MRDLQIEPIGVIHSPYETLESAPRQGKEDVSLVEVYADYEAGLDDVEGFSHLHIFYWLHESEGYSLSVQTPWDDVPHGLFATRSPRRPNPVGYSVVRLLEKRGKILKVEGLDAIEGTPVVDIKPYIPRTDSRPDAREGWLEGKKPGE
jgi:formylmethanofuran dehydrogenase subunit E